MSYNARRLTESVVESFDWQVVTARPVVEPEPVALERPPAAVADDEMRLAALERDAFAKGYAEGERAGHEVAATRAEAMLRRLGQTIEELAALRSEMIRRTERQTVQLVLAIAERVVLREVTLDRTLLVGMARAALDRLGEYGSATIRLHPDDFAAIGAARLPSDGPVQVVADAVVTRGGCLVQSDFGFMDVTPEAQFRELARALLSDNDVSPGDSQPDHGTSLS